MKEPIKREFWCRPSRQQDLTNAFGPIGEITEIEPQAGHNLIHVISADWAFNEINKLKEENERYKEALKEIKKNSVIAYPDRLRKYINEVLKDE